MIKSGFQEEGETFREDSGFRNSERLRGDVKNRMGMLGVSVGREC